MTDTVMAFSSASGLVTTSEMFACKHKATQRYSSILGLSPSLVPCSTSVTKEQLPAS